MDGKIKHSKDKSLDDYGLNIRKSKLIKAKALLKDTPSIINPKILESWINETLGDAEHLNIPGIILKPESKVPVTRYNIDRMTLSKGGIPHESINRIYRSLFVYSVGFYDLIVRCMEHSNQNHALVSSIWKVFAILIEYCCKSDYTMLISSLAVEHKKELDRINSDFAERVDKFSNIESTLRKNIDELEKDLKEKRQKLNYVESERLRLIEIVDESIKSKEKEVQLRVKFEEKINNMHALNRTTEEMYERAKIDIDTFKTQKEALEIL